MKYKPEQMKPVEKIADNGFLRFTCCGCGMVHVFHFRKDKKGVVVSHFRDELVECITRRKR